MQFYLCTILSVLQLIAGSTWATSKRTLYVCVYMQLYLFTILSVLQCVAGSLWALFESIYKCMCISLGAILPVYVCMYSMHIWIHVIYTDVQVACNVSSCTCVCSSVPVVTPTLSLFFSDHLIDAPVTTGQINSSKAVTWLLSCMSLPANELSTYWHICWEWHAWKGWKTSL